MQDVVSRRWICRRTRLFPLRILTIVLFLTILPCLVLIEKNQYWSDVDDLQKQQSSSTTSLNTFNINKTYSSRECCNKKSDQKVSVNRRFYSYLSGQLRDARFGGVDVYRQYTMTRLGLKPLPNVQPLETNFGPVLNDVLSYRYPISREPCPNHLAKGDVRRRSLFIAVMSAAGYFHKRDVIRKTWFSLFPNFTELVDLVGIGFVVGRSLNATIQKGLEEESLKHKDIIQVNIIDAYSNMTLKVAGLLNWLSNNCSPSSVDFVLKVDDDVYVNVRNLADTLQVIPSNNLSIYGTGIYDTSVQRGQEEKWTIGYNLWPWANYPMFLRGGCILMTSVTVRPLLAAFQVTPYIPFDDVYLSGLCAGKAQVQILTADGMFDAEPPYRPDGCFVRITIGWLTASEHQMFESHKAVDKFYTNVDPCLIVQKKEPRDVLEPEDAALDAAEGTPADPKDVIKFNFRQI